MNILDIGGGFSMSASKEQYNFDKVAPRIQDYLDNVWPAKNSGIHVFGEPGRQICQEAQTLVCQVFLVKQCGDTVHYYINNGVYQGFGCRVFDKQVINGQPLLLSAELKKRIANSKLSYIWGQTCDGVDWITKNEIYPQMELGEWMIYRDMGAYNESLECAFNGFEAP